MKVTHIYELTVIGLCFYYSFFVGGRGLLLQSLTWLACWCTCQLNTRRSTAPHFESTKALTDGYIAWPYWLQWH